MSQPDIVVLAVDASKYSENAFNYYVEHLHKPSNSVTLAHCAEMPSVPSRDSWDNQSKAGLAKGKELEAVYMGRMEAAGVNGKMVMDFEKPGEYVIKVADDLKATLIVMGTRGMGKIRRTILGSVSSYVLDHAHCPVLVCRSPKD